jgi:hypothetical protein
MHLKYYGSEFFNSTFSNGYLVSMSTEIFANVWTPDVYKRFTSSEELFVGRLEGHKSAIVDGNFLNKSPFFVTIDQNALIIIWEIKTLTCL